MPDDRIRIDPEFHETADRTDRSRLPGRYVGAAGFLAVVALLWLFGLRSTDDAATQTDESAVTDTTFAFSPTTTVTTPPTRDTPGPDPVYVRSGVPLSDLVPGFTWDITMLATPRDRFYVAAWSNTSDESDMAMSVNRISTAWGSGSPEGLDSSGRWFAEIGPGEVLGVYDTTRKIPVPEPVALRVSATVWHDSSPGHLAWLACSRDGTTQSLMTLDVTTGFTDPQEIRTFEDGCERWLHRWGDWGVSILGGFGDAELLSVGGEEQHMEQDTRFLEGSPNGSTLQVIEEEDGSRGIWIVSHDGEQQLRVQIAQHANEWPLSVEWAPDGTLVAIWMVDVFEGGNSMLFVADASTGGVVKALPTGNPEIEGTITWSPDSRFLLFQDVSAYLAGYRLRFYDTLTEGMYGVELFAIVDEFRVAAANAEG